jgi:hypothetical protein
MILIAGCVHPIPKVTVDVLDTSLSITPRAEHAAETAILDQIVRLGRGDQLILIPITGDAENDARGRIPKELYANALFRRKINATIFHKSNIEANTGLADFVCLPSAPTILFNLRSKITP